METGVATCYIGLGSNLGDRMSNIKEALTLLALETSLVSVSSIYETEPWGYEVQPKFLNAACGLETALAPLQLLELLQGIEEKVGRKPTFPLGPRVIDLDILLYGQEVSQTDTLVVPHPGLAERAFVLVPLAEIAPQVRHPVLGVSVEQILDSVGGKEAVRLYAPPPNVTG
jgi:2-amino-4-hydroxy-6-hydroxymethyldihydropteridine diphosphokinase